MIGATSITFLSVYEVQRTKLVEQSLEYNRIYASKMAEMTDEYLTKAMSQLEFTAMTLSSIFDDTASVNEELEHLYQQSSFFNSTYVVTSGAKIVATSMNREDLHNHIVSSFGATHPLALKEPYISDPLISPAGNYMINITHPIISTDGYLGYIGGSVYLDQESMLNHLFGHHSYDEGSYLYVVDRKKTLIYHPQVERVGEVIEGNLAINAVINGEVGSKDIVNSKGKPMLAGFHPVSEVGWGIIAQTSKDNLFTEIDSQMWTMVISSAPLLTVMLVAIWFAAYWISKPLSKLSDIVSRFDSNTLNPRLFESISGWYFEAYQLKLTLSRAFFSVSRAVKKLNDENLTDPMTSVLNRRGLSKAIEDYYHANVPFTVLTLDIDHFKRVNDKFGHSAGDDVLKQTALLIQNEVRDQDMVCRSGGEEFIVFIAEIDRTISRTVAERIRVSIESFDFDVVGHVTISIGMAQWFGGEQSVGAVIKKADDALYVAKRNGRNRVCGEF